MKERGAHLLFNLVEHAVVGVFEVLRNYPFFKKLFQETINWIQSFQPKAILLVDYPGFNLRLAESLRKLGISQKGGGKDSSIAVCESATLGLETEKKV